MGEHVIKLPDVGEGVAEAELVEWHVKVGDLVREDALLAAVMTDKATVEIPSPVDGEVLWLGAEIGETVAVGSPIVRLKVAGEGDAAAGQGRSLRRAEARKPTAAKPRCAGEQAGRASRRAGAEAGCRDTAQNAPRVRHAAPARRAPAGEKPLASPAVRLRAREAGIDLRQVAGTGPAGRITHEDLDAFLTRGPAGRPGQRASARTTRSRTSRSSGCAAGSPRRWRSPSRASRTSPMSRRSTSPRSRNCAPTLNKEKRAGPAEADAAALPDARDGQGDRRAAAAERALRRRGRHRPPPWRRPYRHRHADAGGPDRAGGAHAEARDLWDCAAEVNRLAEAAQAPARRRATN